MNYKKDKKLVVVATVVGGVLEITRKPKNVTVRIHDYDISGGYNTSLIRTDKHRFKYRLEVIE